MKIVGLHCGKWGRGELRTEMKTEREGTEGVMGKMMMGKVVMRTVTMGRGGMYYSAVVLWLFLR